MYRRKASIRRAHARKSMWHDACNGLAVTHPGTGDIQQVEASFMAPALDLRLRQHLALTPQLQQALRLLQLSALEFAQEMGEALVNNPFLEESAAPDSKTPHSTTSTTLAEPTAPATPTPEVVPVNEGEE